jgi:hypothetical protein
MPGSFSGVSVLVLTKDVSRGLQTAIHLHACAGHRSPGAAPDPRRAPGAAFAGRMPIATILGKIPMFHGAQRPTPGLRGSHSGAGFS